MGRLPEPVHRVLRDRRHRTDSGAIARIGGCATQQDAGTFARSTRTYFYEFADRNAPGLNNDHPGYQ